MRSGLSIALAFALVLLPLASVGVGAQPDDPGSGGPPEDDDSSGRRGGSGNGGSDDQTGGGPDNDNDTGQGPGNSDDAPGRNRTSDEDGSTDATDNETTSSGTGGPGQGRGRGDTQRSDAARERLRELIERWSELDDDSAELPEDIEDRVGHLQSDGDNLTGNFVRFTFDEQAAALRDYSWRGRVLIESIHLPYADDEELEIDRRPNALRIEGDQWRVGVQDSASAAVDMRTDNGAPFLVVFPEGTEFGYRAAGVDVLYPRGDGTMGRALLQGDVSPSEAGPTAFDVSGNARFFVIAGNAALPMVGNLIRDRLDAALENRTLGAEVNVLKGRNDGAVKDTVLFEDMDLELDEGDVNGTEAPGVYTITVDAAMHEGKTIAVNFESGLIDAQALTFRYFNVDANRTVEAPIVLASNISDVLDPLDDGTVAEYWVVEDVDGIQVLVSIPNFSIHKIELRGIGEIIIEQPSLVLGVVGAVVLVSMATAGLFRRPKDDDFA